MIIFLEDWHANNFGRAQLWQHSMIDTRPEKAMMGFLLDTGPLEPRLKSLTERIGRNNAMLTSFALAEVYRKENRNFEAVSHYNAFLAEVVKTDREVLMQYFIRATRFVKEHENATDTGPSRESNDT